MDKITIKKATLKDMPSIRDLVVELAVFEKEPEAVKATTEDYEKRFQEGLFDSIIATYKDEVVGMTIFYDTFSTWRGKMLYLEDFYVKASFRSQGIGDRLFDAFIEEAKQRSCTMVKWEVLDWNQGAKKFYLRKGATIETFWHDGKIIF
ncbi:MAG: GNAT family N-acetyltransferase [Saprospiraceae bacterium]|nr:GNAT family N-acetyltransferase [Bacteroidia bacterium]NNL91022.1 GNAT family N-acetyltransferase [Saprospiraceae bacterium]